VTAALAAARAPQLRVVPVGGAPPPLASPPEPTHAGGEPPLRWFDNGGEELVILLDVPGAIASSLEVQFEEKVGIGEDAVASAVTLSLSSPYG